MKLSIGCGREKEEGYDGLDNVDFGQKYIHDITQTPWPIDDASYNEIRAHNVLEHISPEKVIAVMNECYRILKPGGILDIIVPRYSGGNAVIDPTHRSMWEAQQISEGKVNMFVFWDEVPKSFFEPKTFSNYFAGSRPRNADYGMRKWAIESDGEDYTWEVDEKTIRVRMKR